MSINRPKPSSIGWMKKLGVEDVSQYSTHSLRKTKPSVIYAKTHNVDAVRPLNRSVLIYHLFTDI